MESRILDACREELAGQITPRAQILDVGAPAPQRCDLLLERSGEHGGRARLVADLSPSRASLYLARPVSSTSTIEHLRRHLVGRWILEVDRPVPGPVLRLVLSPLGGKESRAWIVFEWLGGSPEAVVVDEATHEVLATLGEPKGPGRVRRERGAPYHWPASPHKPAYERATEEQVVQILHAAKDSDVPRALTRGFSGLPRSLAYEAAHRGGSDPAAIAAALRAIASEPFHPVPYAIPEPPAGIVHEFVSPIRLSFFDPFEVKRPGGLFRILEQAHDAALRAEAEDRLRDAWLTLLAREEARLVRLHGQLTAEADEASTAPRLRRQAEALLIHLAEIRRGAARFTCPDPKDADASIEIELDPRLTPAANAEALFRRAKRLERGASLREKRIRSLEEAIARLSALRDQGRQRPKLLASKGSTWLREALGSFKRETELSAWERKVAIEKDSPSSGPKAGRSGGADRSPGGARRGSGPQAGRSVSTPPGAARRGEDRFHPRMFTTREGWTVLVGRSNQENDYVTHRLAKPDDYWFHVHGCPGSHVVLRREGRKDNPSARTIEEVASIAAFFSKARTSRKAPVIYTLKKYVRKGRGGEPGLAIVTRERTIMVVPEAPTDAGPPGWGDEG
jgi:predicted ribosome quality control (RQC) complex YloA/Tae2 family protein